RYGSTSGFPSDSFQDTNYWVDPVFVMVPPDTTPPTVTGVNPPAGAIGLSVWTTARATFSEPLNPATVTTATFELLDATMPPVAGTVSYNPVTRTATLAPAVALTANTLYTARLHGGSSGPRLTDLVGNALAANVTWSFT